MNKCIFSWFGYIMALPDRLKLIKESGFDATCLWWEDEVYPNLIDVDDMPKMVKDNGLHLDNIHCPYKGVNELWSPNKDERKQVVDSYFGYIDKCKEHDIPYMVMHATDYDYKWGFSPEGIESFTLLARRAQEVGVKIAVENTRDKEIIDFVLTEIDSPNLGLCYDSSHDFIMGQSEGELLKKWKKRLLCTHLSDNDRVEDKHWLPEDGEVAWGKIMPEILGTNIDSITMELMSSKIAIDEPKTYLQTAYNRIVNLMKI